MSLALIIVILHVIKAGKLGLADYCEPLRTRIALSNSGIQGQNVRFAVLYAC